MIDVRDALFFVKMRCLDARRSLLAAPRERSPERDKHVASCPACRELSATVGDLDSRLADAFLVPPPDAIDERILLARRLRAPWRYA